MCVCVRVRARRERANERSLTHLIRLRGKNVIDATNERSRLGVCWIMSRNKHDYATI